MDALPDWLAHRAATMPAAEALRCDQGSFTYAELNQRVLRLAGALQMRGVTAGDRIAVLATNYWSWSRPFMRYREWAACSCCLTAA